ncbi:MAG: hypothetical protein ACXAC5_00975 [Promethearchaeota archaeon]|jgi:hypothetical protein
MPFWLLLDILVVVLAALIISRVQVGSLDSLPTFRLVVVVIAVVLSIGICIAQASGCLGQDILRTHKIEQVEILPVDDCNPDLKVCE